MIYSALRPEIPGYTIESIVGNGGFATVYLAQQHSLKRDVALKVMMPALTVDPDLCARFLREARYTASLSDHEHIVTVHDVGQVDSNYYFSMQHLPGANLKQRIEASSGLPDPLTLACQIADALEYIHQKGFVHRDIKPANILFTESGRAVLSDFGIARLDTHTIQLTQNSNIIGTAKYMSPEQCRGEPNIDARSDLYSFGVVLFEVLTGYAPFETTDPMALMLKHLNDPPPRLPSAQTKFQIVIDTLLAKQPEQRFESAAALLQALKLLSAQGSIPNNTITKRGSQADSQGSYLEISPSLVTSVGIFILVALTGFITFLNKYPQSSITEMTSDCMSVPNKDDVRKRDALLALASAHEAIGRLTHPPGANALEAYSLALDIDPCNQDLITTIKKIRSVSENL